MIHYLNQGKNKIAYQTSGINNQNENLIKTLNLTDIIKKISQPNQENDQSTLLY